jgi:ribose/xylose/arabinose/galactoside ABC-type transport system permease subunit
MTGQGYMAATGVQGGQSATPTEGVRSNVRRDRSIEILLRLGGLFLAILVVGALFTVLEPAYLTVDIQVSVLRAMSSLAIMALGLTLVIVIGEIDLSFGATYGLAANVVAVLWILHGWSVYTALLAAVLTAVVVGVFNGVLVTRLGIPSFIVTLGSYNLIYGLTLLITKAATFNPSYPPAGHAVPKSEVDFFTGISQQVTSHNLSLETLWMLLIGLIIGVLLHRTVFGFRVTAIGGNEAAARLARLPVDRYKIVCFVICAVLAALAGIFDFAFIGSVQPDAGLASTFPVFAAVVIGGASLTGGRGTVVGTLGGALLLASITTGLSLVATSPAAQQIFLGAVTIGAVLMDLYARKVVDRRRGYARAS